MLANAGDHIEHHVPVWFMIGHIIAGDHPGAMPPRQRIHAVEPGAVAAIEAGNTGHPDPTWRLLR